MRRFWLAFSGYAWHRAEFLSMIDHYGENKVRSRAYHEACSFLVRRTPGVEVQSMHSEAVRCLGGGQSEAA